MGSECTSHPLLLTVYRLTGAPNTGGSAIVYTQLGSTGVVPRNAGNETSIAGTLGHGTKIRYISFPDVHNLYSSLPEPKLLDHGTKIRYISVPEVPTRYRTKKYLLGTKFFVADCIKLWRINIRYLSPNRPILPLESWPPGAAWRQVAHLMLI